MSSLPSKPSLHNILPTRPTSPLGEAVLACVCAYCPTLSKLQWRFRPSGRAGALQGGGLGAPAAAAITFLGGDAGPGGADTPGGFGGMLCRIFSKLAPATLRGMQLTFTLQFVKTR